MKFSGSNAPRPYVPQSNTRTHEGGAGWTRSARQELFLQAVVEMNEDTFYETVSERQARLAANVQRVVSEPGGWSWLCEFTRWLRHDAGMRSAAVMVAAEAVAASASRIDTEGLTPRQLVNVACVRADEPAEFLGYWLSTHGRQMPAALRRGVADAAGRLYTERNVLKYDGQSRAIRMADVLELVHPKPQTVEQSALFKAIIDRRHNRDEISFVGLPVLAQDFVLQSLPEGERRANLANAINAGWSWERVAGWLPGGMDAEAWESLIPSLGYMALLRNLRNFEQAGVSAAVLRTVADRIADPEQVARSRQFPYRLLSAWQANQSLTFGTALEQALGHSVRNVPDLPGRTLVLIDTSGSMQTSVGGSRSQMQRWQAAALFGAVISQRCSDVDLAIFAQTSKVIDAPKSANSILRFVEQMQRRIGEVGHATYTWEAIQRHYDGHDRIVVLTDEQSHDSGRRPGASFAHFINLAGYAPATAPKDGRTFTYGGFTDAMFSLIPLNEHASAERWPWES